mmetsp:Transcript_95552/g.247041  ORF Transcript_95552/g.247041 Transcript_95552/m.247041 type:complete len:152 (-) Transcript_95552:376-831(-)
MVGGCDDQERVFGCDDQERTFESEGVSSELAIVDASMASELLCLRGGLEELSDFWGTLACSTGSGSSTSAAEVSPKLKTRRVRDLPLALTTSAVGPAPSRLLVLDGVVVGGDSRAPTARLPLLEAVVVGMDPPAGEADANTDVREALAADS